MKQQQKKFSGGRNKKQKKQGKKQLKRLQQGKKPRPNFAVVDEDFGQRKMHIRGQGQKQSPKTFEPKMDKQRRSGIFEEGIDDNQKKMFSRGKGKGKLKGHNTFTNPFMPASADRAVVAPIKEQQPFGAGNQQLPRVNDSKKWTVDATRAGKGKGTKRNAGLFTEGATPVGQQQPRINDNQGQMMDTPRASKKKSKGKGTTRFIDAAIAGAKHQIQIEEQKQKPQQKQKRKKARANGPVLQTPTSGSILQTPDSGQSKDSKRRVSFTKPLVTAAYSGSSSSSLSSSDFAFDAEDFQFDQPGSSDESLSTDSSGEYYPPDCYPGSSDDSLESV